MAAKNRVDIMEFILSVRNVDVSANNYWALKVAIEHGSLEATKYMIENMCTSIPDEIIVIAAEFGDLRVVKYLCKMHYFANYGAAFVSAAAEGHTRILRFLNKEFSVQFCQKKDDEYIKIAQQIAANNGHKRACNYLRTLTN